MLPPLDAPLPPIGIRVASRGEVTVWSGSGNAREVTGEVGGLDRPIMLHGARRRGSPEVPVEGGTGRAVVYPAASTLREEMAMSGQRLLAASGQIPMAAHIRSKNRS